MLGTRSLLRQHDFRSLWLADAVSQFGTQVSGIAVLLLAITTLHASTLQVSVLRAVQTVPFVLIGLQVGAWCDRWPNRPVLIAADLGRAVVLASIPLAWAFHELSLAQLYVVIGVAGGLTVFFDVAHQSVLPRLIDRERLVEGNAKLQGNMSVAGVLGPAAGGGLVQALGGPFAVLLDATSYLWSAWWLRQIRPRDTRRRTGTTRLTAEIGEGLRVVFANRMLRSIGLVGTSVVLFQSMGTAIDVVFLARTVGLDAGAIGLLSGIGTFGAVAAALSSRWITTRLGPIRSLAGAVTFLGVAFLVLPLSYTGWRLIWYAVGTLLGGYCIVAFNIVEVSYQQAICPEHLLGRMSATMRFLFRVTSPIGALLGGVIATTVGTRLTLAISGLGIVAAVAWLIPLRRESSLSAA